MGRRRAYLGVRYRCGRINDSSPTTEGRRGENLSDKQRVRGWKRTRNSEGTPSFARIYATLDGGFDVIGKLRAARRFAVDIWKLGLLGSELLELSSVEWLLGYAEFAARAG